MSGLLPWFSASAGSCGSFPGSDTGFTWSLETQLVSNISMTYPSPDLDPDSNLEPKDSLKDR